MTVRRLKEREAVQGANAKLAALIGGPGRVGTLEGVEIDFHHPDLPPDWEALPWWYVWGPSPNNAGLMFPSEAKAGGKELRNEASGAVVYVRQGDKVTVEAVTTEVRHSLFDDPHDREVRLAMLRVERPTGEVAQAGPLAFYGNGRLLEHGSREAFDHVIARVLRHNDSETFPQEAWDAGRWALPLERIAAAFAKETHSALFKLLDTLPPDGGAGLQRAHLRQAMNGAVLTGFLLAKLEAVPATERAEKQVRVAQMTAADKTPAALLAKAREIAAANPTMKRKTIAREMENHCDRDRDSIYQTLRRNKIGPEPVSHIKG